MSTTLLYADDSEQNHIETFGTDTFGEYTLDITIAILQAYAQSLLEGKKSLANAFFELLISHPVSLN